jgi:uncharacterized protein (TIGR03435 family)
MPIRYTIATLLIPVSGLFAQAPAQRPKFDAFEVATIKPAVPTPGRYMKMQSNNRFYAKAYSVKYMIGAAFNLTQTAISGGPGWADSDTYDIVAGTPGEVRPTLDEQMSMMRSLLADRFKLTFHTERKELPIFSLTVAKNGPKLKDSVTPEAPPELINVVYPDHIKLPARNATIAQFASMMQRGVLDRPVADNTGLTGKYDFDLEWLPDESQFGGKLPKMAPADDAAKPSLFAALQEQIGLRLQATKGPVETIVIDHVERPSGN